MLAEIHARELLTLLARIDGTEDVAAVVDMAASCRRFCVELAEAGVAGAWLARTITDFNNRVVGRLIRLTAAEHRLPSVPWCWLALGSQGRGEQTFVTDQDNGLLFSAADTWEAESLREFFLPMAEAVNERLDRCGFTYCGGEVMARNPKWCLSLEEWQWHFSDWVRRPEPMALMHSTIFFDFQPMYGDKGLGEKLRKSVLGLAQDTPAFLHLMAVNALQSPAPLSFLGDVVTETEGPVEAVDLKKSGARIFVDAARIFALAQGVEPVGTIDRLTAAGQAAGMRPAQVAAAIDAFSNLLRLRLNRQAQVIAAGGMPDHRVSPQGLHDLDQVILRECLRQAKRIQQRLRLNYGL